MLYMVIQNRKQGRALFHNLSKDTAEKIEHDTGGVYIEMPQVNQHTQENAESCQDCANEIINRYGQGG